MNSAPGQQRQAETGPWAVKPARGRERNTIRRHLQWDLSIYTLGSLHKREADLETSKTTYDHTQKKKLYVKMLYYSKYPRFLNSTVKKTTGN